VVPDASLVVGVAAALLSTGRAGPEVGVEGGVGDGADVLGSLPGTTTLVGIAGVTELDELSIGVTFPVDDGGASVG